MRLSESNNVLIMSAIYRAVSCSESPTHCVFSSPYPSISRTGLSSDPCDSQPCYMPDNHGTAGPWSPLALALIVGIRARREAVNGEFDEQAKIFIQQKSFFGGVACKSPHIQQLFLAAAGQFWISFWLGLLVPPGHGRDLPLQASERGIRLKTAEWFSCQQKDKHCLFFSGK